MSRTASESKSEKYHVPALEKSLNIFEYLVRTGGRKLGEICEELDISKTTAYSILKNLEGLDYIYCDNGAYRPTLKIFSLGMSIKRQNPGNEEIVQLLKELCSRIRETVHFINVLDGKSVLTHKIEGPGLIRFASYVGETKALHLSGAGKAALACMPDREIEAYISKPLESRTSNSIADPAELLDQCRIVREQGYSLDNEEGEKGVFCIGVPVYIYGGEVYAGLSASMLKANIDEESKERYIRLMIEYGERLSRTLGYKDEYPKKWN